MRMSYTSLFTVSSNAATLWDAKGSAWNLGSFDCKKKKTAKGNDTYEQCILIYESLSIKTTCSNRFRSLRAFSGTSTNRIAATSREAHPAIDKSPAVCSLVKCDRFWSRFVPNSEIDKLEFSLARVALKEASNTEDLLKSASHRLYRSFRLIF